MNIDKVRFGDEFVVPNLLQEGGSGQHFVVPLHHVFEQQELARPEINLTLARPLGR
jgi:hypothetical protein